MKEKSIMMNQFSVKAILEDRKTQTRRLRGLNEINKNPNDWNLQDLSINPEIYNFEKPDIPIIKKGLIATFENNIYGDCYANIKCPYEVGMKLWVREIWQINKYDRKIYYLADYNNNKNVRIRFNNITVGEFIKWKSSRFMLKKYARIWLEVRNVRVERIADIKSKDCFKEGFNGYGNCYNWFYDLWNSINAKKGYSWENNPFVFVTEFKHIDKF